MKTIKSKTKVLIDLEEQHLQLRKLIDQMKDYNRMMEARFEDIQLLMSGCLNELDDENGKE
jgi:hypothetical protein